MQKLLVLLSTMVMVVAFSVSAMAGLDVSGSVQVDTFLMNEDEDAGDDSLLSYSALNETDTLLDIAVTEGNIGGVVELVPTTLGMGSMNVADINYIYGTWKNGGKEILIGKAETPIFNDMSSLNSLGGYGLAGRGLAYESPVPMMQLTTGGLKIAILETSDASGATDVTNFLPKMEASYTIPGKSMNIHVFGGFHSYADASVGGDDDQHSHLSYLVGANLVMAAGSMKVKGGLHYAVNADEFGLEGRGAGDPAFDADFDREFDATTLGLMVAVELPLSKTNVVEAGLGRVSNTAAVDDADPNTDMVIYVNDTLTLAKGVSLIPEFAMDMLGEDDTGDIDEGTTMYIGAAMKLDF